MKVCKVCGIEKPLADFHRDKSSADGRHYRCAVCKNKWAREEGAQSLRNADKKRNAAKPERRKLWSATYQAIITGKLVREPCEVCGETKVEAHHDDYTKPLNVRWLCKRHHIEHHLKEREEEQRK